MNFDDIRPYSDPEIPDAVRRIAALDVTPQIMHFVYPGCDVEKKIRQLTAIKSSRELQSTFMNDAIKRIIAATTDGFTHSGFGYLRRKGNYLIVSNHRDITLDAFLLQHLLLEEKGNTSYIVFGDNLLSMPAAAELFRCNKLISMHRGGTPRAFYESLAHLSAYINTLVTDSHESVWIAQKNGRAKDGLDRTAPAMLKMLAMGSDAAPCDALAKLNIVPMSISYEWDPCDIMKANELVASDEGAYTKAPGEDLASVVTGIQGPKGMVHIAIGKPLSPGELVPAAGVNIFDHVAEVIDRRIIGAYKLMPSNYAAFDLINSTSRYRSRYNAATVLEFIRRSALLPDAGRRQRLLEMYANPVVSALALREGSL